MTINNEKSLEKRAKNLLRWKITKRGKIPNPFTQTAKLVEEIQFLIDKGYIVDNGANSNTKSAFLLGYYITPEGRKYALNK